MLVPFTSINFSNVKAQEYGAYDDDYNDDMYSTYPTEVNKYECRTGPLEGFYVSSVEFCKFNKLDNDDNKRDNRTGTQGPPGPQGPQGERGLTGATGTTGTQGLPGEDGMDGVQGPRGFNGTNGINGTQGPPGPNQISNSSLYVASGEPAVSGPTQTNIATSFAKCDVGDTVISGPFIAIPAGSENSTVNGLQSLPSLGNDGWSLAGSGRFLNVQAFAYCFDNPPLR